MIQIFKKLSGSPICGIIGTTRLLRRFHCNHALSFECMGFSDIEAGVISGTFSACLYLLPTFAVLYPTKLVSFSHNNCFSAAYFRLWWLRRFAYLLESAGWLLWHDHYIFGLNEIYLRWSIVPILVLIVIGGSFIKAVISGTVARETTSETRASGYAVFYMMVNIGAFTENSCRSAS